MADEKTNVNYTFPIGAVLGTMFIYLKLTHQIDWTWTWVLAPFWIPLAAAAVVLMIAGGFVLHDHYSKKR